MCHYIYFSPILLQRIEPNFPQQSVGNVYKIGSILQISYNKEILSDVIMIMILCHKFVQNRKLLHWEYWDNSYRDSSEVKNILRSSIGKFTFGTPKLVHYSEFIRSIRFYCNSYIRLI